MNSSSSGPYPDDVLQKAEEVITAAAGRGWQVGAAESCTGGLIMGALTAISGSSAAVSAGFITYSNKAKIRMLGVDASLIRDHGAVSPEVAAAMARGALDRGWLDLAVAVTGVAGPTGGTAEKPVGLVQFAVGWRSGDGIDVETGERRFGEIGRDNVRMETVRHALSLLVAALRL